MNTMENNTETSTNKYLIAGLIVIAIAIITINVIVNFF